MRLVGKQWQLLARCQQHLWLLMEEETVEDGCQQAVYCSVKHISNHGAADYSSSLSEVEHELLFGGSTLLLGL